jgi:hypothetical protein
MFLKTINYAAWFQDLFEFSGDYAAVSMLFGIMILFFMPK